MIKIKFSILFFLIQLSLFGQNKSLKVANWDRKSYQLDAFKKKFSSGNITLDSIEISINDYGERIETTSIFKKSKTVLKINFYISSCQLFLVRIKEQSPWFSDLFAASDFYFENDSIFHANYYRRVRGCMAIPLNTSVYEIWGYNPSLTDSFLKNYIRKLYAQIRNMPDNLLPLTQAIN